MNLNKLKTNYEPKKTDLEWTEKHLEIFRTGQHWMTSYYTVLVDKEQKLLKVVHVIKDKEANEHLACLVKVLHPSKWKVINASKVEIEAFQKYRADFGYFNVETGIGYFGNYN